MELRDKWHQERVEKREALKRVTEELVVALKRVDGYSWAASVTDENVGHCAPLRRDDGLLFQVASVWNKPGRWEVSGLIPHGFRSYHRLSEKLPSATFNGSRPMLAVAKQIHAGVVKPMVDLVNGWTAAHTEHEAYAKEIIQQRDFLHEAAGGLLESHEPLREGETTQWLRPTKDARLQHCDVRIGSRGRADITLDLPIVHAAALLTFLREQGLFDRKVSADEPG